MPSRSANLKRDQFRSCASKVPFASRDRAIDALLNMSKRQGEQLHIKPYRCKWCHQWHLGHDPVEHGS